MTEEYLEQMRWDLGLEVEPYTNEEIDFMYEVLKALKEVVRDPQLSSSQLWWAWSSVVGLSMLSTLLSVLFRST